MMKTKDFSREGIDVNGRRYANWLSRCLLLGGVVIFGATSAYAAFGSIAYNETNGAWGKSYNYSSQGTADQRALDECAKKGSGCKVVKQFANECAAYARSAQGDTGWATAWTKRAAENTAVGHCKRYGHGCEVIASACAVAPLGPSNPGQPGSPGETTYNIMMRECINAGGGNLNGSTCVRY